MENQYTIDDYLRVFKGQKCGDKVSLLFNRLQIMQDTFNVLIEYRDKYSTSKEQVYSQYSSYGGKGDPEGDLVCSWTTSVEEVREQVLQKAIKAFNRSIKLMNEQDKEVEKLNKLHDEMVAASNCAREYEKEYEKVKARIEKAKLDDDYFKLMREELKKDAIYKENLLQYLLDHYDYFNNKLENGEL